MTSPETLRIPMKQGLAIRPADKSIGPIWPIFADHGWWLWALLLLTLALRIFSAAMADPIRGDSVHYIHCAKQLESGDLPSLVRYLGPNLYPVILQAIHKLGFDYELGGKLWGVLVSTLTLLPLVGLARRQFGRPVAMITGFLYAVHPRFIEWGPEIIRDPTFWLFFVLTLYCLRRSVESRPWMWRLASGASLAIAIHLRFEGWLLLLPAAASAVPHCRFSGIKPLAIAASRLVLLLAVPAAALITLNLTVFRENPQRARLDHVVEAVARKWTGSGNDTLGKLAPAAVSPPRSPSHQVVNYFARMIKGVDPWLLLPLGLGLYRLRRKWRTPEFASAFVMCGLIYGLVAAYLFRYGEINTRYSLAAVLALLPYAAYGLIGLANQLRRAVPQNWAPAFSQRRMAIGVCGLLLTTGTLESMDVNRAPLIRDAALAGWVRQNCGEGVSIASWPPFNGTMYFDYYARTDRHIYLPDHRRENWEAAIRNALPQVVLVEEETPVGREFLQYIESNRELGYRQVFVEAAGKSPRRVFARSLSATEAVSDNQHSTTIDSDQTQRR